MTVVSDLDKSSLLEVIDSHKNDEIIEKLKEIPIDIRENVKEVSVDMWGGFPSIVQKVFTNARLVIDRFHVRKLVNKSLNELRLLVNLKGLKARCLLLKNGADLTEDEQEELKELLNSSTVLSIAYELKENLRNIYETTTTVKMGIRRLTNWLVSAKLIFGKTADTIKKHLLNICNYFLNRTTSGVMERLNNKIKLIIRQGYGFKTFESLRTKLLACLFK